MVPGSYPAILTEAVPDLPQFLRANSGHRHDYEATVSFQNLPNPSIPIILPWTLYSLSNLQRRYEKPKKLNGAFKLPVDANDTDLFREKIYVMKKNTEAEYVANMDVDVELNEKT